jgi:hypothetical protein
MVFKDWLTQIKSDKPELSDFITKLDPFFTDTGFNASEFEKRILIGLKKVDTDINNSINPQSNVTS